VDRERLADIIYAVRDVPEFDALYDLGSKAIIAVSEGHARTGIAARLTALPPMDVDIMYRPTCERPPVTVSAAELAAARARHEARLDEWSTCRLESDANYPTRPGIAFVIVSTAARAYAGAILEFCGAPVRTYTTENVDHVEELVAIHRLKPVFVLDEDLDGTKALAARLNGAVRWISSSRARIPEDVEAILSAIHLPSRRALQHAGTFAKLRILVVDIHDGSLDREAQRAAPGAHFERAIGWDALERIGEEQLDVVIAGEPRDISLASLARFVQRCKTTPLLLIASDRLTTERMRSKYPELARYFIERPLCAEDLLRVLRMG
jgi:hypothetical protein